EPIAAAVHQGDKAAGRHMIERGDFTDIGPPDKGALPRAAEDGEPQLRVVPEIGDGVGDLDHQLAVEAVQLGDVVDRDVRKVASFWSLLAANHDTHRTKAPALYGRSGT